VPLPPSLTCPVAASSLAPYDTLLEGRP